jgi:four helix bundle protein
MTTNQPPKVKIYDLEERTALFAKHIRDYLKNLPRSISNIEYAKQLVRSSGSVAANYIEANESHGE